MSYNPPIEGVQLNVVLLLLYPPNCTAMPINLKTLFCCLKNETQYLLAIILHAHPLQLYETANLLSISTDDSPILGISYKWNHTVCGLQ